MQCTIQKVWQTWAEHSKPVAEATGNARSPSVLCRVVGMKSVDVDPEQCQQRVEQY